MEIKKISPFLSVSPQIYPAHVERLAAQGFRTIINNRPDNETDDQPLGKELSEEAIKHGIEFINIPVIPGELTPQNVKEFGDAMSRVTGPVLAYCRSGMRSTSLWALYEARHMGADSIINFASTIGYDLSWQREFLDDALAQAAGIDEPVHHHSEAKTYDVVVVGGGSAGIAAASSLLRRRPQLDIVVVEPRYKHFYQPGFTMVGGGIFAPTQPQTFTKKVMPDGVRWIEAAAASFDPDRNQVILEDGSRLEYRNLVVAPGLKLDWDAVEGLHESLGKNGVTSNYRFDYAPYTWELVKNLKSGRAIFTQPQMPIKCAGAPQKAMYLSCDHWLRNKVLDKIDVSFCNAGGVLFGIDHYVPPLMEYVRKYDANLELFSNLVAVDGEAKKAWFDVSQPGEDTVREEMEFDMLHVCPPQTAPDFIINSPLSNEAGWVDVAQDTLRHKRYGNVFSLGDACSAPNAKTLAAARLQAPVVAENLIAVFDGKEPTAEYNGYGSCPLTVEKGKIVLAEFGYGGKLLPTFPEWLIKSDEPSKLAWFLKEKMLPTVYYQLMLKGREWLAKPDKLGG
ncbi:MAG: bifunctional protein tyrosine phosphatase family protein/NAD(P)/FAD-dependent oxidoreductase [Xanthomonadales bacterium]|nr:bifunctional protein tyrosine phosphatase family protein/NAD(P)/FAD-dependent oxidoreductase [Xanthomonadales bacterium]